MVNIKIRKETANHPVLLNTLQQTAEAMVQKLEQAGIAIKDGSVKIWVKQFGSRYYPKIEFDVDSQELQYDMNADGSINETHFKTFSRQTGVTRRMDIGKAYANPTLIAIDDIIKQ